MKIEIIGYKGVVGGATYELFKRLGYGVVGSDKGDVISTTDTYFVCVPEDSVDSVIGDLPCTPYLVVVRSTTPPGTLQRLMVKYGFHICHNPEFLREATALQDEMSPSRIVIGECCKEHGDFLECLYKPLRVPIVRTDPTTSELVKLASNCYLATVISYWNEIEKLAQGLRVSGHQVGMIASMDPRISPYGARLHGKYGGRCLPKDMDQLITSYTSTGCAPILLRSVKEVNDSL